MKKLVLEVCVDSFESINIAKAAGADRIELCSALNIGGLTPSYGLMKQAKTVTGLEIFVMIRPRSGDFLYDEFEFQTMKEDIKLVKELGFDGIVTGVLLSDGRIDLKRIKELVELAYPLPVVFHRAFDRAKDPMQDMEALIDMGICRILTSGQRQTAIQGVDFIAKLQKTYGDKITIMPGSGIHHSNIRTLIERTGCTHYHLSGKVFVDSEMTYRGHRNTPFPEHEFVRQKTSFENIKKVRKILDSHMNS